MIEQPIAKRRKLLLMAALFVILGTQIAFQFLGRSFFPFVDYDMFARSAAGDEYTWYFLSIRESGGEKYTPIRVNRDLAPLHIRGFVRLMNERSETEQAALLKDLAEYLGSRTERRSSIKLVWNKRVIDIESFRAAEMATQGRAEGSNSLTYKVKVEKLSESI